VVDLVVPISVTEEAPIENIEEEPEEGPIH
jgi:hypothetical protein